MLDESTDGDGQQDGGRSGGTWFVKSSRSEACRVMRQFSDLIDSTRAGTMGRGTASYGTSSSSDSGASSRKGVEVRVLSRAPYK